MDDDLVIWLLWMMIWLYGMYGELVIWLIWYVWGSGYYGMYADMVIMDDNLVIMITGSSSIINPDTPSTISILCMVIRSSMFSLSLACQGFCNIVCQTQGLVINGSKEKW
ncbi:hypothetical protein CEXT_771871 [Caerostris extrusa]|uniref:Uncharacterized protein n=1 Tax=Caerostris extrusa TaxID=172846 RepID=A0AAV4NGV5_CAEEX|nr:hypothetical protein CEXT_771871 [Caerostris extrusa]